MPPWTPVEIATKVWLDASDATTLTVATGVREWRDKSGNGLHVSQATEALRPTVLTAAKNELSVLDFSGSQYMMSAAIFNAGSEVTVFCVFKADAIGTTGKAALSIATGINATNGWLHFITRSNVTNYFRQLTSTDGNTTGTVVQYPSTAFSTVAWHIVNGQRSASQSGLSVDGVYATATAPALCAFSSAKLIVGGYDTTASLLDGQIAEIIVLASAASTGIRQKIEGYLAWKWGVNSSLPTIHPYYASPPESDITYTSVMAYLDQAWGDPTLAASLIDQPWGIKFGADLAQAWSDAPVIRSMLSQPWGNAQPIRSQLVQRWQDMIALRAQLNQPWAIMESLLVTLSQPWAITSGPVQALLDQGWSIQDIEPVMAMLHQPWAITADGSVLRYQVEVLADGQLVRTSHVNIEGGLDGDVLTCEIHPETEAEYLLCPYGAELVVTVTSQEGTDTFSFVVIEPRIAEEHGKTEYVVVAMSQAVLLGEPYADGQGGELSGLASEIAAVLAAPVPVSWETVDWTIPAGVWIASGETPLALLKTLAAAVGAVVQADPDGTLAIRPKYRIPLPNLDQATVDLELTEILDCFSTGDTPDHRSGYNRYLVGNQSASSDTGLTLEQTAISAKVKEVRGYQVPWAGDFELTHTGGPWVVIEPMGIEEREETETVEFVAGAGKTKFPIHGLVAMEWQRVNLGTVTTAEDGGLAADSAGQSLLTITYTTRCKLWRVHDLKSEQLQLVAEL